MAVLAGDVATRMFARLERRRKAFVLHGPQAPLTRALRLEISSPWPCHVDDRVVSAIKSRDKDNELIYDRLTAQWHLYRVSAKSRRSVSSQDILVRQGIEFGGRTPGWWLIQEMDRSDLWKPFDSKEKSIAAQFKAGDESEAKAHAASDAKMEEAGKKLADGFATLNRNKYGLSKGRFGTRRRKRIAQAEKLVIAT